MLKCCYKKVVLQSKSGFGSNRLLNENQNAVLTELVVIQVNTVRDLENTKTYFLSVIRGFAIIIGQTGTFHA